MGLLFDENFEGYAVGQNLPFGPWSGSGGSIAGFGVEPSPGHCINGNGTFTMFLYTIPVGDVKAPITLFFSLNATEDPTLNPSIIVLANAPPGSPGQPLLTCGLDGNSGMALLGPSGYLRNRAGFPANSNIQTGFHLEKDTWYFFQLDVTFDTISHHVPGDETISVSAELQIVGGGQICNGNQDSGILQTNLYTQSPDITRWQFQQPNGLRGGALDNITAKYSDNDLPNPAAPGSFFTRITQATLEVSSLPNDGNVRISQAVHELLELPDDGSIRASQWVIELMRNGVPSPQGGWQVKDI